MATNTMRLRPAQFAMIDGNNPTWRSTSKPWTNSKWDEYQSGRPATDERQLLIFARPDQLRYSKLLSVSLAIYIDMEGSSANREINYSWLDGLWNAQTVTWNDRPGAVTWWAHKASSIYPGMDLTGRAWASLRYEASVDFFLNKLTQYGLWLSSYHPIATPASQYAPYVDVTYDTTPVKLNIMGFCDSSRPRKSAEILFSWRFFQETDTLEPIPITGKVKFRWKEKGSSVVHESLWDQKQRISIPAGTIQSDEISYQIEVSGGNGTTATSEWDTKTVASPQVTKETPVSGFVSKAKQNVFTWAIEEDGNPVVQKSAVFEWRVTGQAVTHQRSIPSGDCHVEVPAGTFTSDSIDWRVRVTTDLNYTAQSDWHTLSTVEPLPTAFPVAPKNTVVDGSAPITFSWEYRIESGTPQTKYELQTSTDGVAWTPRKSDVTGLCQTTLPKNTFGSGTLQWKVRVYNTDSKPGPWSEPVSCIVVAAPLTPAISIVDSAPKFQIRWNQSEQEAFELRIDDVLVCKRFGVTSAYTHTDYLTPGTHTVSVRIQNKFGLWSPWGSAALQIVNTPGPEIQLTVEDGPEPQLRWSSSGSYAAYLIYRDGKLIARTDQIAYKDHFALGAVAYQVRGVCPDSGCYTLSNEVYVMVQVKSMKIAAVDHPVWLDLGQSANSLRTTTLNSSRPVTFKNYVGQALPSAEIGSQLSQTYNFDVAWRTKDQTQIQAFEALLGKAVCLKTPSGRRLVGVLSPIDLQENYLITSCTATITLIEWKEGNI